MEKVRLEDYSEVRIDERTTVPFWWAVIAIPTLLGGMTWLTFISYTSEANARRLTKVEDTLERKEEILIQIREDVAVIKQRLEHQQRR